MAAERLLGAAMAERRRLLLEFLTPGIVHALNNDLFAIRGYAQVLGMDQEFRRERDAILKASDEAGTAVELLRVLGSQRAMRAPGPTAPRIQQPGLALRRICDVLRAPLRELGAKVSIRRHTAATPPLVDAVCFHVMLADAARAVGRVLPQGFRGTVAFDLQDPGERGLRIVLEVEPGKDFLPFPIDLEAASRDCGVLVEAAGGRSEVEGRRMLLDVPVSEAVPPNVGGTRAR